MGWKGAVRSIGAACRAAERDAKRRQRELEKQQKQYEKMQVLEQAAYEVEVYQNNIDLLQSMHKECGSPVDWKATSIAPEPEKPESLNERENQARNKAENFQPGFISRILKKEDKKRDQLKKDILKAIENDELDYNSKIESWKEEHNNWSESVQIAQGVLNGDQESKIKAIENLDPFSEISTIGSAIPGQGLTC